MAERRMFAKTIIDSDSFLDMPVSARLLYYDLGMRADDDGFVNSPKKIMKMIGATQDDLSILILKKFIIPFESGVVVIKHWKIHNYIRKDTYNETTYKDEKGILKLDENKAYTIDEEQQRLLLVDEPSTQVRLGKVSIGKDSIDNITTTTNTEESQFLQVASEELINVTPMMFEMLLEYEKEYGEEICILAIKECSKYNVRTMAYLETILQEWRGKSLEEIKASIEKHSKNKLKNKQKGKIVSPIPDWLDKSSEKEEDDFKITDEERERFGIT